MRWEAKVSCPISGEVLNLQVKKLKPLGVKDVSQGSK